MRGTLLCMSTISRSAFAIAAIALLAGCDQTTNPLPNPVQNVSLDVVRIEDKGVVKALLGSESSRTGTSHC